MDGFQKLTHSRGAQRRHAYTHGVEHDRDAHAVGLRAGQQHSIQFARRQLADIEHKRLCMCGHRVGLFGCIGHDRRCADGEGCVCAVVDRHIVGDTVNDRLAVAQNVAQRTGLICKLHVDCLLFWYLLYKCGRAPSTVVAKHGIAVIG